MRKDDHVDRLYGFIKLHRKVIEWGWYADSVVKDVFLHILLTATFKDAEYLGYQLRPGQAVIGRKKMADELGYSEQQVRTALKKLESTGEISLFSTNRFTIATVENWEFYQCEYEEINQQSTNNQPTINQQITNNQPTDNQQSTNNQPHLKNVKNVKNAKNVENKKNNIFIPPTLEDVKNYCKERGKGVDAEKWMAHYESNGWMVGRCKMKDWRAAVRTWERAKESDGNERKLVSAERSRRELGTYL